MIENIKINLPHIKYQMIKLNSNPSMNYKIKNKIKNKNKKIY
jgi:hypothetical protein